MATVAGIRVRQPDIHTAPERLIFTGFAKVTTGVRPGQVAAGERATHDTQSKNETQPTFGCLIRTMSRDSRIFTESSLPFHVCPLGDVSRAPS